MCQLLKHLEGQQWLVSLLEGFLGGRRHVHRLGGRRHVHRLPQACPSNPVAYEITPYGMLGTWSSLLSSWVSSGIGTDSQPDIPTMTHTRATHHAIVGQTHTRVVQRSTVNGTHVRGMERGRLEWKVQLASNGERVGRGYKGTGSKGLSRLGRPVPRRTGRSVPATRRGAGKPLRHTLDGHPIARTLRPTVDRGRGGLG